MSLGQNKIAVKTYQIFRNVILSPLELTPLRELQPQKIPFRDLLKFEKLSLFRTVKPYTKAGYQRLDNIYEVCKEVEEKNLMGAFIECGTYKGGIAAIMGWMAHKYGDRRTMWYFDSFEGMPDPTPEDGNDTSEIEGDALLASVADVEAVVFKKLHLPKSKNIICKGWFEETLPKYKKEIGLIAVLRLDADWYEPTKTILNELYDQVGPGGYVIFDDYGRWEGCKKAVDEFLQKRNLKPKFEFIGSYGNRPMFFKKM